MRFLLRPGWLATVLAVLVFAGACFWLLSPWQFGRNAEREAQNQAITVAQQIPPVPLDTLLPHGTAAGPAQRWRLVTVTGEFLPGAETVARLRSIDDEPASEVLTPLRTADGRILLVDRGYVRPGDTGLPAYPPAPAGTVRLTARVQPDEPAAAWRAPLRAEGHRQVYAINSARIGGLVGLTMRPGYVTLTDGSPGVLGVAPLPELDSGPFFSYALQWISFGVMAIGGLGYFTWRELRPGGALRAVANRSAPGGRVRGKRAVAAAIAREEAAEEAAAEHEAAEHEAAGRA